MKYGFRKEKRLKKLILITGVAGFIGSKVANRFIEEGFQVVGVDDLSNGKLKNIPSEVDFIKGDFCEKNTCKKIFKYLKIELEIDNQIEFVEELKKIL